MSDQEQNQKFAGLIFYAGAIIAFLISFICYLKTMAPTVSFWDCGEFIACSYILGVPHPPGTPLFILIGKFFMLLGIMPTPAQNTNFVSVLAGAATVVLAYLLIIRIAAIVVKPQTLLGRLGICIGGLSGSLVMAFSSTFWFNTVETEVYSLATFLTLMIPFIAIKWAEKKASGGNDLALVAISYLLFLSIGIHLTVFLITPALIIYFVLVDTSKLKDWRFWVCWGILFSIAMPLHFFVFVLFPELNSYPTLTWLAMVLVYAAICLIAFLKTSGKTQAAWGLCLALLVAALAGFSTHLYIPIRAAQNPAINENNPSTLNRFEDYMARKQYGQESMVTRMFKRRGSFAHQFGAYPHMGFWGYFRDQYNNADWGILRYLPFIVGLLGIYWSIKRNFKNGILITLIFLIASLGLILYLNFSDGTRGDHLEVRDRDYFWTQGFMIYAILIGIGLAVILGKITDWLKGRIGNAAYAVYAATAVIVILLPIDTASYHWRTHDRTGDYMPPDYAYNILNSCEKDGILFTNGDNDTFPLWYLQEVEGVRKDVRVVNLSLLNTDWYIYQLKHFMNVPVDLEDEQILWKPFDRRGQVIIYRPTKPYYDPIRGINRYLAPFQDSKSGNVIRVQDQMIERIVWANKWKYPVYFSTSVPTSNRWILSDYTLRKGMVLQILPEKPNPAIDAEATTSFLYDMYRYRGVSDLGIYKDENNVGLTTTYPERFVDLAKHYLDTGDTAKAKQIYWDCVEKFPYYYQTFVDLHMLYSDSAYADSARIAYTIGVENLERAVKVWPEITLYRQFLGVVHFANRNYEKAIEAYEAALRLDPSSSLTFRFLLQLYTATNKKDKGRQLLTWWMGHHPEDMEARQILKVYQ